MGASGASVPVDQGFWILSPSCLLLPLSSLPSPPIPSLLISPHRSATDSPPHASLQALAFLLTRPFSDHPTRLSGALTRETRGKFKWRLGVPPRGGGEPERGRRGTWKGAEGGPERSSLCLCYTVCPPHYLLPLPCPFPSKFFSPTVAFPSCILTISSLPVSAPDPPLGARYGITSFVLSVHRSLPCPNTPTQPTHPPPTHPAPLFKAIGPPWHLHPRAKAPAVSSTPVERMPSELL